MVAPASTLHNWQQELTKFVPTFKIVPYWGNTQDRKVLRKFWNSEQSHAEDSSFHVVVTSYQLVIQDVKYFSRIKWHYMVLDEAQAIKSTSRRVDRQSFNLIDLRLYLDPQYFLVVSAL